MNRKKLSLRKETLHELAADEMRGIAGGITHGCTIYPTLADLNGCLAIHRPPILSVDEACLTGNYPTTGCTYINGCG